MNTDRVPVKALVDENGEIFTPLVNIQSIGEENGPYLDDILEKKLEVSNLIAGDKIELEVNGNNITISNAAEGTKLIDNLTTTSPGVGALDARQGGEIIKKIPEVINNLTTIDSTKALSAHQGYILAGRSVPVGGGTGQVLMKSADDDYSLTWGDAADPNAIVGDGSIKKIVELTYDEYIALEEAGQLEDTTEYHISDMSNIHPSQIVDNLTTDSPDMALSAAMGKRLDEQKLSRYCGSGSCSDGQSANNWFHIASFTSSTWGNATYIINVVCGQWGVYRGQIVVSCYNKTFYYLTVLSGNLPPSNVKLVKTEATDNYSRYSLYVLNSDDTHTTVYANLMLGNYHLPFDIRSVGTTLPTGLETYDCTRDTGITSGSNSNGSWTKYPDGTMICAHRKAVQITTPNTIGALYYGYLDNFATFPQPFISTPHITYELFDSADTICLQPYALSRNVLTATSAGSVYPITASQHTSPISINVGYIAYGRWK